MSTFACTVPGQTGITAEEAYLVESPELACSFDTERHGSSYLILVIASIVVILIYFVGVQYALSLTAQHGDEKLRKAIAGNFKKGWHRYGTPLT